MTEIANTPALLSSNFQRGECRIVALIRKRFRSFLKVSRVVDQETFRPGRSFPSSRTVHRGYIPVPVVA